MCNKIQLMSKNNLLVMIAASNDIHYKQNLNLGNDHR